MSKLNQGKVTARYRVAVVDDSRAILVVLKAMFEELGIKDVSSYDDAHKAFQDIEKAPSLYDLVLTDLNMPNMDGIEFIRKLGNIDFPGAVVIISDMPQEVISLASKQARQNNVHLLGNIAKPVHIDKVQHLFHKLDCLRMFDEDPLANISELALLDAISHNRILPMYMPKVNMVTGKVQSLEVMSCILPRGGGEMSESSCFIGVARTNELLNLLTFQLIEKASKDLDHFRNTYSDDLKLAINLHPSQLADLNCPDKFTLILSLNNLNPSDVVIEISEHQPLSEDNVLETINRLKLRGFELSLDEYGSGFTDSQLMYKLPIDEIKISYPLITEIEKDHFSQAIVHEIDDITTDRKLNMVACGVARQQELDYLTAKFPKIYIQGPLITKAMKRSDMVQWLKERKQSAKTKHM
ncbi:EAL domain-containing response regulator [Pseudoalteromonas sp. SSDWG2]|uniref:EAL domain-containing response regulator n=1 Tax=Pseudoalteromonas sp. SSDWG2 TaxID=3139391 RepID=UPI003BA9B571